MLVDKERMIQLQEQNQLSQIIKTNEVSERFGLSLTEQDAKLLLKERRNSLKKQRRIEFGEGIVAKIIYEFCDSPYICQGNYVEIITGLQDIFYQYKNEMQDEITDDELLHLMKEQFEKICFGDLDYLEGTCLNNFAEAIRAGYGGFREMDGYGEYAKFDVVERWDYELFTEVLKDLFWR